LSTIQRIHSEAGNEFLQTDREITQSLTFERVRNKKRYLPIDAYDPLLDEENPHDLIERYRDA
jgi:hypothetical protein